MGGVKSPLPINHRASQVYPKCTPVPLYHSSVREWMGWFNQHEIQDKQFIHFNVDFNEHGGVSNRPTASVAY